MTFQEIGVNEDIVKALTEQGYTSPTPIQAKAIPILLEGKDLLGCAQTGTGKTAAFTIPILQSLHERPEVRGKKKITSLIVTPTRELALQIVENIRFYSKYTKIRSAVIFGGVKQGSQVNALKQGVDILVATPGRLLDLIGQGYIKLGDIDHFVLDEADQMLDMGFIHDIKKILKVIPQKRQSLFFSATMPSSIVTLSNQILGDHEQVTIAPKKKTADKVEQFLYYTSKAKKVDTLIHLLNSENGESTLVFSRTKHGADKIVRKLEKAGFSAAAIHGNKTQNARQKALKSFKDGTTSILVATDIAARGIDVDELAFVVNFDLPNVAETYVHRIGRTGRAKASGVAFSFCSKDEVVDLKNIEKLINQKIQEIDNNPFLDDFENEVPSPPKSKQSGKRNNRPKSNSNKRKQSFRR